MKELANKDLLYGSCIQYLVITYNRKESKKEYIYVEEGSEGGRGGGRGRGGGGEAAGASGEWRGELEGGFGGQKTRRQGDSGAGLS